MKSYPRYRYYDRMLPSPNVDDLLYAGTIYFLALSGLVSIWAVVTRGPWWWRIAPLLLLLAMCTSAGAGDLAWFTLVRAAVIFVPATLSWVWNMARRRQFAKRQFSVRDLLRATAVFAIAVSVVAPLCRQRLMAPDLWAKFGLCCGGLDLAIVWLLSRQRMRWFSMLAIGALLLFSCPAIEALVVTRLIANHRGINGLLWQETFLNSEWIPNALRLRALRLWWRQLSYGLVHLFPAMLLVLFSGIALRLTSAGPVAADRSPQTDDASKPRSARRRIAIVASGLAIALAFVPGAIVWQTLPPPVEHLEPNRAGENHFYEIVNVGLSVVPLESAYARGQMESYKFAAIPPEELESFVAANAQTFREFHDVVWRHSWLPLDDSIFLPEENLLQALRRFLHVYIEGLKRQQRRDEAADAILDQIRFGTACANSPFAVFEYVARRIELEGVNNAAGYLGDIPLAAIPKWLDRLLALESNRLDVPTIRRLNSDAMRWQCGWACRIDEAMHLLANTPYQESAYLETLAPRGIALMRLLRCELAIRAYKARHGREPHALAELVPEWLPEMPADPFGDGGLIYRRSDEGRLLYSVGPNGRDDGGERVDVSQLTERGDLFLDSFVEIDDQSE